MWGSQFQKLDEYMATQIKSKQESVRPRWPLRYATLAEKYMCVIVIR